MQGRLVAHLVVNDSHPASVKSELSSCNQLFEGLELTISTRNDPKCDHEAGVYYCLVSGNLKISSCPLNSPQIQFGAVRCPGERPIM